MFELGEFIGDGYFAAFFRIRGHSELGVKVYKHRTGEFAKKGLEVELNKAKVLREVGLPVPKYAEVVQIKVPKHFVKTLERGIERNAPKSRFLKYEPEEKERIINNFFEPVVYGLVMEYVESDLKLISRERLEYIYKKEKEKIEQCGIKMGFDERVDNNVLWSKKEGKMYFIDFDFWNLSDMHDPIEVKKVWEKEYK